MTPAASAQSFRTTQLAQSTAIRATSAQNNTLYLNNDRIYSYNLVTTTPSTIGGLYIPAGAVIQGRYEPASGGLQYNASSVVINGRAYGLNAFSRVIEDVKDPRQVSAGSIAGDAAIGAAGGVILSEIFGRANIGAAIGGAAAGAAVGNVTAARVVVIEPDTPITLYAQ